MARLVHVKAKHIRAGEPGCCFRCAIALALQETTGDDHANVAEQDWHLRVEVWGRSVVLDPHARRFAHEFDALPRTQDGKQVVLPKKLAGTPVAPFAFTIPDPDDPEWEEQCHGCEELFGPKTLDDEGYCEECQRENLPD